MWTWVPSRKASCHVCFATCECVIFEKANLMVFGRNNNPQQGILKEDTPMFHANSFDHGAGVDYIWTLQVAPRPMDLLLVLSFLASTSTC